MNSQRYVILVTVAIVLSQSYLFPQEKKNRDETGAQNVLLTEIAAKIDEYRSKTITLRLKLKHIDKIFEKITFYDAKNHDIEFDISPRQMKKRIAPDIINAHEGLDYNVTFMVKNAGKLGDVLGELIAFKPVLLDNVPENAENRK